MHIRDLPIDWRLKLLPAFFREEQFGYHTDSYSRASGRRVAIHEFPKRNEPYAEDMGRKIMKFTIQGYLIISPGDTDYIPRRDALIRALEADGPGTLKLPTFDPIIVMVDSYTCTETKDKGGYAAFEMTFCERGKPVSFDVQPDTRSNIGITAEDLGVATRTWLNKVVGQTQGPGGSMTQDTVDAFMRGFGSVG